MRPAEWLHRITYARLFGESAYREWVDNGRLRSARIRWRWIMVFVFLFAVIMTGLRAQAPLGMGPAGQVSVFNWNLGTGAGCSAAQGANGGPRGMCTNFNIQSDTNYWTAWLANSAQLPVTTGLPIIGTGNDLVWKTCAANISVAQLAEFDFANPNASRVYEINCMTSFGNSGGTNNPAGWFGHCSNGDDASATVCTWKSRTPFALDGKLYLPVERQISAGGTRAHDATMLISTDVGQTWRNPNSVANSLPAQATGDAPLCGAINANLGSNCLSPIYASSIMWPGLPATSKGIPIENWYFFQYGQDGNLPTNVGGPCDPVTYVCLMLADGSFARVLRTDLPSLDVTKWQYVASLDSQFNPTFTSTFANRFVGPITTGNDTEAGRPRYIISGPVYLKEFHSYILMGGTFTPHAFYFMTSPGPFGPYKTIGYSVVANAGFDTVALGIQYEVVSVSPPHIRVTIPTDNDHYTPQFSKWDIVLGTQPYSNGDVPNYTDAGRGRLNQDIQLTSGEELGTVIRKGLALFFDFMDAGIPTSTLPFFHDLSGTGQALQMCFTDGVANCGKDALLKNVSFVPNPTCAGCAPVGVKLDSGFAAQLQLNKSDIDFGATAGNQNAPTFMQGNGTFSVVNVLRFDAAGALAPFWSTGNQTLTNGNVSLSTSNGNTSIPALQWGTGPLSEYVANYTFTPGQWVFIGTTIQANGTTPDVHMWIGVGGVLLDKLSGVSRTTLFGTPTWPPAVTAGPLIVGSFATSFGNTMHASYATMGIYNRPLGYLEMQELYSAAKIQMASRGITLQ